MKTASHGTNGQGTNGHGTGLQGIGLNTRDAQQQVRRQARQRQRQRSLRQILRLLARLGHWESGSGHKGAAPGPPPLCGARTRRDLPCRLRVVAAGKARCRLHGGLSTGPKTAEGRARIAESNRRRAQARRHAQESRAGAAPW